MSVFESQFSRARPYSVAYAGEASERRFWTPGVVTAGAIAGAGAVLLADAAGDAVADRLDGAEEAAAGAPGDAAAWPFDPAALDDATLELPEYALGQVAAGTGSGEGSMVDAFPGLHTVSGVGEVADISPAEAALLDDGSSTAWSHHNELLDTTVGGDGEGFSYVNTGDTIVTIDDDGGVIY